MARNLTSGATRDLKGALRTRLEGRRNKSPRLFVGATVAMLLLLGSGIALAVVGNGSSGASAGNSASQANASSGVPSLPSALANGPDQSAAPFFSISGGAEEGFGGFNGAVCSTSMSCVAVGADDHRNSVASWSSDGGAHWTPASFPRGASELNGIDCADSRHCIAVGRGVAARSGDGGATWQVSAVPISETTLLGVSCPTVSDCVAGGVTANATGPLRGAITRTSDGGVSWSEVQLPQGSGGLGAIACPTPKSCISVGASILKSSDGGMSWRKVGVPGGIQQLFSIACSSATTCVALGPNPAGSFQSDASAQGIITSDAGESWSALSLPSGTASLSRVTCPTPVACKASGSAVQSGGTSILIESSDGGRTWSSGPSGPDAFDMVADFQCEGPSRCIAVGRSAVGMSAVVGGMPATSSSGGTSWTTTELSEFRPMPASKMEAS